MAEKILAVDDEESILRLLTFNLEQAGYEVIEARDGIEAREKIRNENPDLVILDVMLPGLDGLSLCRQLRKEDNDVPILMLTARGDEIDKIFGLEMGADDYVTKPFSPRELVARVNALLRRAGLRERKGDPDVLATGDLTIYPSKREVWLKGRLVELTPKEFELLELLARNPGRVMSRSVILDTLWGYEYFGDTRIVDVHISHLREKIEDDPAHPYIETVRGVGYKFRER